ncbi:selenocysteine-specific translation elongation factor [Clostridium cylindrosporum]|uniref:Selenocysteine-specific elongation factor n=1 Tax=Clostridium cylindrosporum DSM 605 TaxID=1121307 RepID=A0A0J8D645_CLOCY|nr:selenocysteine-specific translation elongation factor [Clostridium cylindrosporum]KMT21565.1 selenocysteine-specific elongation factor SelB [Clostridium cylindrosporum DSM 605]
MQHIIVGTAGHIDHGKTSLIKALTGRNTDTLSEEKERGISINLGFTYFDFKSGKRAGIVDVPGHEKFIKNMLAGISGIDIVLLVIAADEGIMPQTREHLNILELLDIKKGIVVLTKKDMVDEEWLEMIKADIKEEVSSTFLKDAPIVDVSSIMKEGINDLIELIDKMTDEVEDKDLHTEFRLPVDRVFSVSGFGTVVTGTLISGTIKEGDECTVYPEGFETRVRGIQVHESSVKEAFAGQRVAINLANIKKTEVKRGDCIGKVGIMENTMMIDCRLKYLKDAARPLKNRDRVRVYHGTTEVLGRVVILDKETVEPSESAFIQIRLEDKIAVRRGDKYVIRSYSPMITIGGGTILDPNPKKHKSGDKNVIAELELKEKGSPEEIVEQAIKATSNLYPKVDDLIKSAGKGIAGLDSIVEALVEKGRVRRLPQTDGDVYLHVSYIFSLIEKSNEILGEYHKLNPLKAGMSKEEFKNKLVGKKIKQRLYDEIIKILEEGTLKLGTAFVAKKDFEIKLDKRQEEIRTQILKEMKESMYQPPKIADLLKSYGKEERTGKIVFDSLVESNVLVKVADDIYLYKEYLDLAREKIVDFLKENGEITAAQFRDLISASRKYAVPILEYFDGEKVTKRVEDRRILL